MTADKDATRSGPRRQFWFVLGGARSGKSSFALSLAEQVGDRVVFVATAQAMDEEMRERIARHRRERPDGWRTLEAPSGVGEALRPELADTDVVVVDCLGFLVANVMGEVAADSASTEARVEGELDGLLRAYQGAEATFVVVSNEVGAGVVPPYPSGRVFRDALGRANQRLAREADRVYWMLAGLPVEVKTSGLAERWER
jgi:adenosylcobinamide kinase/adenosylcobinamide-phosphate guanylyltransferase